MNSYFRFLSHHKLFTAINILGLCLSMAFLLLLGDLIYRQTTVESYQTRADRTYALGNEDFINSHFRVGQKLMDRFPDIEDWCSVAGYNNLPLQLPPVGGRQGKGALFAHADSGEPQLCPTLLARRGGRGQGTRHGRYQ